MRPCSPGRLPIVGGQASFTTSSLALGSHTDHGGLLQLRAGLLAPAKRDDHPGRRTQVINVSINDVSLTEGQKRDAGRDVHGIAVTTRYVTITVQARPATAPRRSRTFDYLAASGTLTFAPGEVTKPVPVTVFGDSRFEPNETFAVNLSNPSNATLVDAQGIAAILNDDPSGPGRERHDGQPGDRLGRGGGCACCRTPMAAGKLVASATNCGRGPGVSCPNTIGVTALALLAAHASARRTSAYLNAAVSAGNAIVSQFNSTPTPGLPHTQDVEFLSELSQITGNTTYSTTATAWFQVVRTQYGNAAANVDQWLADRDAT